MVNSSLVFSSLINNEDLSASNMVVMVAIILESKEVNSSSDEISLTKSMNSSSFFRACSICSSATWD